MQKIVPKKHNFNRDWHLTWYQPLRHTKPPSYQLFKYE